MTAKDWLFVALGAILIVYLIVFVNGIMTAARRRAVEQGVDASGPVPSGLMLLIGFVTNFFDTLGIGSFATTTAVYKLKRVVPVRLIPGTLNVGHTIPTIAQAFIYTKIVPVDSLTLISMIAASCLGSWLGAGVVAKWPRRTVQLSMGAALLGAAALLAIKVLGILPSGGQTLGLSGGLLVAALAGNFLLGMLMMIGIGLYAPCMILIALLGMNPAAAFPIMMGSCAFLMPTSSIRFVRSNAFHVRAALGLAIGGLPGVLIAAYLVKSLPLTAVYWLVIVVVVYTAVNMLVTAAHEDEAAVPASA
jgi:uncharacterized membrane protein YfcA